jgi:PIN domain nuclease of toxin-antitoxin system
MRLLVDTHILLWALGEPGRLGHATRTQLESAENEVFFSAASIWEIAIKVQAGRLTLPLPIEDLSDAAQTMGFVELPVRAVHAAGVSRLPSHHRDPFDRLLVAQAMLEPAWLLTADRVLEQYSDVAHVVLPTE